MLVRKLVRCLGCGQDYILRFGVGLGYEQRLGWPCPHCHVETRAHFSVKQKAVDADFKSDDIHVYDEQPSEALLGVNVYSELPVHSSSQGKGLDAGGSAWLQLMSFIEKDRYGEFVKSKEMMQQLRLDVFPVMRRGVAQYKRSNWDALQHQIKHVTEKLDGLKNVHPAYAFSRILDMSFVPILDVHTKIGAVQEILDLLNEAGKEKPVEFHQFLNDAFASQGFELARGRCLDALTRLFDVYDSLVLPLATERFKQIWRSQLNEFRVYRDDFDTLKVIYQDIFESMNQLLLWIGMLANFVNRSSVNHWSNGEIKSFSKASKWRAVDLEFIIKELPKCEQLFVKASRSFRNKIGHYSVHYDVVSGDLVFGDGSTQSLIEFHEDLLSSARLLSVLVGFCEKMTLDHERLIRRANISKWKA